LCEAAALERPLDFPAPRQRKPPRAVRGVSAIVRRRGRLLLVQRPSRGLLGGLWEVPSLEGDSIEALRSTIRERFGLRTSGATELGSVRHAFTHRMLDLSVWSFEPEPGRLRVTAGERARFCDRAAVAELPLSTLMRKTLALADAATR
jgi:A/G-specific adenine glycosylase